MTLNLPQFKVDILNQTQVLIEKNKRKTVKKRRAKKVLADCGPFNSYVESDP